MRTESKVTIATFKTVTRAIAQSENLEVMCNYLAQLLVAALDIKGCAIFFLNPESKELGLLASFGLSPTYLTKGPLSALQSIAAGFRGKPVIVPDLSKDATLQYPEEAKKEGISAIVSIPISFSQEIIGVLRLYHHEVWELSEEDIDSLQILAANIALAMAYTRLLNAVQSISDVTRSVLPESQVSG